MNQNLNETDFSKAPNAFTMDELGNFVEIPKNANNEYEYNSNVEAIESITRIIDNYQMRTAHMDFKWKVAIAQTHIKLIIELLQEIL